jgi:MscS family membrane protein
VIWRLHGSELDLSRRAHVLVAACVLALGLPVLAAQAQTVPDGPAASPAAPKPEAPKDVLGRSTPRGTVLGFLGAARKGEDDLARQYLNTRLTGEAAESLARQLFVVLDASLPSRLSQVSDESEGSRAIPSSPSLEIGGTIVSAEGDLEIVVERVPRGDPGPIWLFSSKTLGAIPRVHEEITLERSTSFLPRFLTTTRVGGIRLVEWVAIRSSRQRG